MSLFGKSPKYGWSETFGEIYKPLLGRWVGPQVWDFVPNKDVFLVASLFHHSKTKALSVDLMKLPDFLIIPNRKKFKITSCIILLKDHH